MRARADRPVELEAVGCSLLEEALRCAFRLLERCDLSREQVVRVRHATMSCEHVARQGWFGIGKT